MFSVKDMENLRPERWGKLRLVMPQEVDDAVNKIYSGSLVRERDQKGKSSVVDVDELAKKLAYVNPLVSLKYYL